MSDCIFCMIASGEIQSTVFYEDELCVAFDDMNPQAPVHSLVVPKEHFANLSSGVPEQLMGHLLKVVEKVAEIKGIDKTGYRTVINTGADADQVVQHLHIHVCGGAKMIENPIGA